jgi:hypothetical protein
MMFSLGLIFLITGSLGAHEGNSSVPTLIDSDRTCTGSAMAARPRRECIEEQHRILTREEANSINPERDINTFFTERGCYRYSLNACDYGGSTDQDYFVVKVTTQVDGVPLIHRLKPMPARPGDCPAGGALPPSRQNDGAPIYVQYDPKPEACGYRMEMKRWQSKNNTRTYWGLLKWFSQDKKVDIAYVVDPDRQCCHPPESELVSWTLFSATLLKDYEDTTIDVKRKLTSLDSISQVFDPRYYYCNQRVISEQLTTMSFKSFKDLSIVSPVKRGPVEPESDASDAVPRTDSLVAMDVDDSDNESESPKARPKRKRPATPHGSERIAKQRRINYSQYSDTGNKK